jgi:hypothetical protein
VPAILALIATASARAEPVELLPVAQEILQPNVAMFENPNFNLMVLEVLEAHGGETQPLEATVRITEVLRGRPWVGQTATASWDWVDWWEGKKYRRPAPGTRFLAAVRSSRSRNGTNKVIVVRAFDASSENLQTARRYMAPPDPSPWPIMITPVIGLALLALAKLLLSTWVRTVLVVGALATALATLVLYYDYERNMSVYTTIRIDIFLIMPAVGAALAIPIGAWWLVYRQKRGGTNDDD